MATLFLIRHAEPEIRGVFLGQMDPPLSAIGREQAAAALGQMRVAVAYTSPLLRARETAQCLRTREIVVLPQLREIDQGEWTGKTWDQIEAGWPAVVRRKKTDWLGVTPPSGEPWPHFLDRIRDAWQVVRTGLQPAAIVGHQAVNAALAYLAENRDPLVFSQQYGEVTSVEYAAH